VTRLLLPRPPGEGWGEGRGRPLREKRRRLKSDVLTRLRRPGLTDPTDQDVLERGALAPRRAEVRGTVGGLLDNRKQHASYRPAWIKPEGAVAVLDARVEPPEASCHGRQAYERRKYWGSSDDRHIRPWLCQVGWAWIIGTSLLRIGLSSALSRIPYAPVGHKPRLLGQVQEAVRMRYDSVRAEEA
jgi:hypothetical protein